jgi:hypothetical protein
MTFQQNIQNSAQKQGMSLSSVYVITLVAYAAFAIPVTIIAFDAAWFAGVAVAICVAGLWPKMPKALTKPAPAVEVVQVAPSADAGRRSSGNASFDAYRDDMLARLEQEQDDFEVFLERLRAAKDATEFDNFMDERVKRLTKARIAHPQT